MKLLPRRRRLLACLCWAAFIPLLAGAQEGAGIPAAYAPLIIEPMFVCVLLRRLPKAIWSRKKSATSSLLVV